MIAPHEVEALGSRGFFLREGFLGRDLALAARDELRALYEAGAMLPAGTTRARIVDQKVRGDVIAWLDPDTATGALGEMAAAFAALRDDLNRDAWLGLRRVEIQLARYGPGAHYDRHRDAFPDRPGRRCTCVLWLNEGWAPAHGGELRVFPKDEPHLDIPPVLDRVLVSLADVLDHEVRPTFAERFAVTAWWHGREDVP